MTSRTGRRCPWTAGLVSLLVLGQGCLVSQGVAVSPAQAAPARPAAPGWVPGCGPMGLQAADQRFIVMMIPHHRMGVMMASHAQWNTQHPQLRQLEAAMVRVQNQEIAQMEQWYRQWYGASGR